MSCSDDKIIKDQACKNLMYSNFQEYTRLMNSYCNKDLATAKSNDCVTYCRTADQLSDGCKKLRESNECTKLRIPENECNYDNIRSLKQRCGDVRILVGAFDSTNVSPCNENAIKYVTTQCNTLNIPMSECSPEKVSDELIRLDYDKQQTDRETNAANRANIIQNRSKSISDAISTLMRKSTKESPSKPATSNNTTDTDYTAMILIVVGVIIIVLSAMSALGVIVVS